MLKNALQIVLGLLLCVPVVIAALFASIIRQDYPQLTNVQFLMTLPWPLLTIIPLYFGVWLIERSTRGVYRAEG